MFDQILNSGEAPDVGLQSTRALRATGGLQLELSGLKNEDE